jgi:hypothetical protein
LEAVPRRLFNVVLVGLLLGASAVARGGLTLVERPELGEPVKHLYGDPVGGLGQQVAGLET